MRLSERVDLIVRSFEIPALVAMLVYVALSSTLHPEFPFARVDMYSDMGRRHEGASPVLLADGEPVDIRALTRFRGLSPSDIDGHGFRYSEGYVLDDWRNYVATHRAPDDTAPGPIAVSFAWRTYHVDDDGRIHEDGVIVVHTATAERAP